MSIKIEDVWYKPIDKKDYPAYLQECKLVNEISKFKIHEGKVVYKIVNKQELEELNNPVKKEVIAKENLFNPLSVKLLTNEGKKIIVGKTQLPNFKPVYKQVPFIVGQSTNYQYCDKCNDTTNHYKVMGILACGKCRWGVM